MNNKLSRQQQRQSVNNQVDWKAHRGCGKIGFPSKKVARGRARAIGPQLEEYQCRLCGKWHLGHRRSA